MEQYHIRRVGVPATIPNMPHIMKLQDDVIKFGRNPHTNDFHLDSSVTKCLISRNHAEIHRVNFGEQTKSSIKYVLHSHGMNGTYVNNIRLDSHQILQEGDVINFGHKNGINIQPGQLAMQPNSEFCFVFERVSHLTSTSSRPETVNSSQNSEDETPSGELNLTALNHIRCVTTSSEQKYSPSDIGTRMVENISRNNNAKIQKSTIKPDTTNSSLVDVVNSCNDSSLESTICASNSPCANTHNNESSPAIGQERKAETPILEDTIKYADRKVLFPNTSTINELTPFDKELMDEVARVSCHFSSDDDDDGSTSKGSPQIPTFSSLMLPLVSPIATSTRQSKREKVKPKRIDDENVPPPKRKRAAVSETTTKVSKRPDKGRKSVQVYKKESCSSIDCRRPQKEPIDWVQCDDCDQWYHMECAGCSLKDVQNSHTEFHCGIIF